MMARYLLEKKLVKKVLNQTFRFFNSLLSCSGILLTLRNKSENTGARIYSERFEGSGILLTERE